MYGCCTADAVAVEEVRQTAASVVDTPGTRVKTLLTSLTGHVQRHLRYYMYTHRQPTLYRQRL